MGNVAMNLPMSNRATGLSIDCCQNNMSMTSIRKNNVSMFVRFMDTFFERVHVVNMKKPDTPLSSAM